MSDFKVFTTSALSYLLSQRNEIVYGVMENAARHQPYWHPYGFAVFSLRSVDELGQLRLHVWPRGFRVELEGHPPIHCHDWDLASLVIGGCYEETIYDVVASSRPGAYYVMEVCRVGPQTDAFQASGQTLSIIEAKRYRYPVGESHCIPAGQFHETDIPRGAFAVTLVVTGNSRGPRAILSPVSSLVHRYRRPPLSEEDKNLVLSQLGSCLPVLGAATTRPGHGQDPGQLSR
jgi:hypothetical protein